MGPLSGGRIPFGEPPCGNEDTLCESSGRVKEKGGKGLRVLVAEDNAVSRMVARSMLERRGLKVGLVEDGRAAVAAVAKGDFQAVLMDVQMPVMDGLEATRIIREKWSEELLPIFAMTANDGEEDRAKCLDAGMNDVVTKPLEPEQLFYTLGKWGCSC